MQTVAHLARIVIIAFAVSGPLVFLSPPSASASPRPQVSDANRQKAHDLSDQAKAALKAKPIDQDTVVSLLKQSLALDSANVEIVLQLADAYRTFHSYTDGVQLLTDSLRRFPIENEHKRLRIALADMQFAWGEQLFNGRSFDLSVPHYQAAYEIDAALRHKEASHDLNGIGRATILMGHAADAIAMLEQALTLSHDEKDQEGEANSLTSLGNAYLFLSQYEKAIGNYEPALTIFRGIKDRNGEARAFYNLGVAYTRLSQYEKAVSYLEQALPIYREIKNRSAESNTLAGLGIACFALSQYEKANGYYEQALLVYRETKDRNGEARALAGLGPVYANLSQYTKAIGYLEQALAIYRDIKNRNGEANVLNNLGENYLGLSQYEKAISDYGQARTISHEIKDRNDEVNALAGLGEAYNSLSQYEKAIEYSEQALTIYREIKDRDGEARALGHLGMAHYCLGQYEQAIGCYEQALAIYREIKDRYDEANMFDALGVTYLALSQYGKAISYYKRALTIFRKVKSRNGVANALNNLGLAYDGLSRYEQAVDNYEQALSILRKVKDRDGEAGALNNLGMAYKSLRRYARAIGCYEQALTIYREIKDRNGAAHTLVNLGVAYDLLSQPEQAIGYVEQALSLCREVKDRDGEATSLDNLMDFSRKRRNPELAIFYGKQSVNVYQSIRADIKGLSKQIKEGYTSFISDIYRNLADLLIAQGRLPEAQQVLDLLKQEEYFEFVRRDPVLADPAVGIALTRWETKWADFYKLKADKVTAVAAEIEQLQKSDLPATEKKTRLLALSKQQEEAASAFDEFLNTLSAAFAKHAQGQTLSEISPLEATREAQKMADTLRSLDDLSHSHCAALYTLVAEKKLWIIVDTPGGQIARSAPASQQELNKAVFAFRQALTDPHIDPRPLGKKLYGWLIAPVEKDLGNAKVQTLMWSLDGSLRYLPVGALWDGKQYLIQRFRSEVFTQTSLSALERDTGTDWTVLGLGVSKPHPGFQPLPAVPEELRGIVRDGREAGFTTGVMPGTVLLDGQFTKDAMEGELLTGYRVVHIASHFAFSVGGDNSQSYLLLGDGSTLSLADLEKMPGTLFQNVKLVCLSACNTAMGSSSDEADLGGKQGNGSEVDGLGILIQRKGADAVLASLWPVADRSTELLMKAFYRERQAHPGKPKLEALQRAQLALLTGEIGDQAGAGRAASARAGDVKKRSTILTNGKKSDMQAYTPNSPAPYAHPYYWAPFVLIGNWR